MPSSDAMGPSSSQENGDENGGLPEVGGLMQFPREANANGVV